LHRLGGTVDEEYGIYLPDSATDRGRNRSGSAGGMAQPLAIKKHELRSAAV